LWLSFKALAALVSYFSNVGIAVASAQVLCPSEALLERYRKYLLDVRGLVATSARGYVDVARAFVSTRVVDGELD
jgi:hypothetical protein